MMATSLSSPVAVRSDAKDGYTLPNGSFVTSVTTILKAVSKGEALIQWAARTEREAVIEAAANLYSDAYVADLSRASYVASLSTRIGQQKAHQKLLDKAAHLGSSVHRRIEWDLRTELGQKPGPPPSLVDGAEIGVGAFLDWRKDQNLVPELMEQVVWSKAHDYAGTLDLIGSLGGRRGILDFKTSKAVYPEHHLQLAAYVTAVREMGHGPVEWAKIVRLPKTVGDTIEIVDLGHFGPDHFLPIDAIFQAFLAVKRVHDYLKFIG